MAAISIDLPQDLREFIDATVRQGPFARVNDYIVALVESARDGRSAIEGALLEGLESGPAEEWTKDEWAEIEHRKAIEVVRILHGARNMNAELRGT